jgi:hypothetical protein
MPALKDRIRAAAIATPALTAILGVNPFRWYDQQLVEGSAFPAVVVQSVSDPQTYAYTGMMPTSWSRYQFTLWGVNTGPGILAMQGLETALQTFLNSLNVIGISGLVQYPNLIVAARDGFKPLPKPGNPQRLIDVMIFNNNTL